MIQVKYFGMIAEATSKEAEEVALTEKPFSEILSEISSKYKLGDLSYQIAVNKKLVSNPADLQLKEGDEIAFLPPFSGG
ncbi:MoaD/ThiS family protein [Algoriphagus vanfongensis]|uniref:MoaD/ThiS family protein n=1 Tax=Algoriphagus vanfongensis TaxID=426371 RepID=UPI00047A9128|nr:MoaD/ThiS family protein [Algoriphagus vanfongensis]